MPRNDGTTPRRQRRKHAGHRIHRRSRLARLASRVGRGRKVTAWGRAAV